MAVDNQRKKAYRYLLYWAMLFIRSIQLPGWRAWNPIHWRRESRRVQQAGAIAYWLHNLALYSAHDFDGFNEQWFWRDFEAIRAQFPELELEYFRDHFERYAMGPSEAPETKKS